MQKIMLALFLVCFFSFCKKKDKLPPINNELDLDGPQIQDSSLITPQNFLLSAAVPNPASAGKQKHVVIAVHGFSASNFEWLEFHSWSKTKTNILVSRVLLGGHGRDYKDFRDASWINWQQPILDEYNRLRELGYTKISFIASSTGCPLVLDLIAAKKIETDVLKHIYFIDPIVVPSNKLLPLIPALGGTFINYTTTELDAGETGYWYKYRPQQALRELDKVTRHIRKKLEKGITLPSGISLKVYKSEHDGSADPVSAVIIKKGIKNSDVITVGSKLHVFTRLKGRAAYSDEDKTLQLKTFEEIYSSL
jgi:carboxylesterase